MLHIICSIFHDTPKCVLMRPMNDSIIIYFKLLTDAPQLIEDDEEDIEELENVMPTLNEIASQIKTER